MRMTLVVHILAGSLGLIFGYVALYAAKGSRLHRRGGMLFVYSMLTMSVGGLVIAAGRGVAPATNIPAALLTSYLAVTALTTIRPARRNFPIGATRKCRLQNITPSQLKLKS